MMPVRPEDMRHFIQLGAARIAAGVAHEAPAPDLASVIDHTLLKPDATHQELKTVCEEARRYHFATVCVNAANVRFAAAMLEGSTTVPIAVVGFPLGAGTANAKAFEAKEAIRNGAQEIDMVINIGALRSQDYTTVLNDITAVVAVSQAKPVKVILETGMLDHNEKVIACSLAKIAGAAFVKTSTGFGPGGATVEDVALMRSIVGASMGVKASGGVRTAEDARKMLDAGATRIGASASVAIVTAPLVSIHGPVIIAHRGGALEAPENTLAGMRHGIAVGADFVELDVTLSADDEAVVIHDDTLDRTTNGTGKVSSQTLAQLKTLSAGCPTWTDAVKEQMAFFKVPLPTFGDTFASEKIPTLIEVLALQGARCMIEMKAIEPSKVTLLASKVVEAIAQTRAYDRVVVGSFDADLLFALKNIDPSIPLIGLALGSEQIASMLLSPIDVLGVRIDHVAEARAKAPKAVVVWGYTACSVEMAMGIVAQGGQGIITDVPRAVMDKFRPALDPCIRSEDLM